jgi:3-hydroxyisobutyrate dehydrogenase
VKTGFIGLGAMGAPMARNLHRAGLLTAVWNRTVDKAVALAAESGVEVASDPADLARRCDVIVTCVSADGDLLATLAALAPGASPGLTVIDCSTVAAATARDAAALLAAHGAAFLDAPVSGGVEGAKNAALTIMVGGAPADFERVLPVLKAMGKAATLMGPVGHGQATKATNQIMCAGIIQAVGEAMAFAKAEGLPLAAVVEALGQGAGSSWYFVNRAPFMVRGSYPAGFRVRLHDKDLKICRDMAARHSVALPVVESTLADYQRLIDAGHGDEDISTIFRLKDALFSAPGA